MTEKQKTAIELLNRCHSYLYLNDEKALEDDEYMLLMEFVIGDVKPREPIAITGFDVMNDINRRMRQRNGIKVNEKRISLVLNIRRKWMNVLADLDEKSSWRLLTDEERTLREHAKERLQKAETLFYHLNVEP